MFVETLRSYMTDEDSSKREKGIKALSHVLLHLPQDYLIESELHFITTFYCDKLKDDYTLLPFLLNGIQPLVSICLQSPLSCALFFSFIEFS